MQYQPLITILTSTAESCMSSRPLLAAALQTDPSVNGGAPYTASCVSRGPNRNTLLVVGIALASVLVAVLSSCLLWFCWTRNSLSQEITLVQSDIEGSTELWEW